jgi:N-acyl-D-aspartate/D-glutamate deacylase
VLSAIEEIIEIARRAGLRVHVSHIKVSGRNAWGKAPDVISMIRKARESGIEITADQYPYIASSTSLSATVIPAKYREGKEEDMIKRLDDPEIGPSMRKAMEQSIKGAVNGQSIRIARYNPKPAWQGKDLAAIATMEKKSPLDIAIEITRNGGAAIVSFSMNDEEMRLFMKEPYVATASDGGARVPSMSETPHPRSYGTFSRKVGRFGIEEQLITLEQAIRSSSGLPADILKLPQRGYLKVGYFADIVVFDPKTFRDKATFDQPHQYSPGVRYLFVNGQLAIEEGKKTDELPGRVLRHGK